MRDVIIACDFSSKEELYNFLLKFKEEKPFLKIGMELFYSCGVDVVKDLKSKGHKIFLDLKLHDIPNTVYRASKVLSTLGVDMFNVHAQGTIDMMKAAKEAIGNKNTKIIAVTQLTSTTEHVMRSELLVDSDINSSIIHLAKNSKIAGLDGVVCSPLEAGIIKKSCGSDFVTVTPGIRFSTKIVDDQKRITTPSEAKKIGSDYIVVGRPITQSESPVESYLKCVKEFVL